MAAATEEKVKKPKVRKPRVNFTEKQRALLKGISAGKSVLQAAKDAGYAESSARQLPYQFLKQPEVQSPLTEALARVGVTPDKISKTILEGMEAKARVAFEGTLSETELPDHRVRGEFVDRATTLMGVVPRNIQAPEAPRKQMVVLIAQDPRTPATAAIKQINPPKATTPMPAGKAPKAIFVKEMKR